MGNFTGSYHWKTLGDFVTKIFTAASQVAQVALGNAVAPNKAMPGDICVRSDLDSQWYIMTANSNPSVIGDWTAITPWEASLIGINAIAQFAALTTIQDALANCVSGVTAAGNPFDIISDDTHRVIGRGGVQPGVTAGDNYIKKIHTYTINKDCANVVKGTSNDEDFTVAGVKVASDVVIRCTCAALEANLLLGNIRVTGDDHVNVRIGSCQGIGGADINPAAHDYVFVVMSVGTI